MIHAFFAAGLKQRGHVSPVSDETDRTSPPARQKSTRIPTDSSLLKFHQALSPLPSVSLFLPPSWFRRVTRIHVSARQKQGGPQVKGGGGSVESEREK